MNILIISPTLPYPPDDGMRIRLYNLSKRIPKEHFVALLTFIDSPEETRHIATLREHFSSIEAVIRKKRSRWEKSLAVVYGLFSGKPPESRYATPGWYF